MMLPKTSKRSNRENIADERIKTASDYMDRITTASQPSLAQNKNIIIK